MDKLLCPSMACACFDSLYEETTALDRAGADIFHMDISDGSFHPSLGLGMRDFECVRRHTEKPLDVHLYTLHPQPFVEMFLSAGADILYIMAESTHAPLRELCKIREAGKAAGLGLLPGTTIESVYELMPYVDYLMINTSYPYGHTRIFLSAMYDKIKKAIAIKMEHEFTLVVDGAISPDILGKLSAMGVNGFVLGTQALFGKQQGYEEVFSYLRKR